ncbi:MAG TPA: hypothetical protein VME20_11835 [Acidimicrobiales bacterium]|nr:hypothetical protein [Acidimicrobiales bacterium]
MSIEAVGKGNVPGAPFKAHEISLGSTVARAGHEVAPAQALPAVAAPSEPGQGRGPACS